jgi:hypothetical protein
MAENSRRIAPTLASAPHMTCPAQSWLEITTAHPKKKTAITDITTAGQKQRL